MCHWRELVFLFPLRLQQHWDTTAVKPRCARGDKTVWEYEKVMWDFKILTASGLIGCHWRLETSIRWFSTFGLNSHREQYFLERILKVLNLKMTSSPCIDKKIKEKNCDTNSHFNNIWKCVCVCRGHVSWFISKCYFPFTFWTTKLFFSLIIPTESKNHFLEREKVLSYSFFRQLVSPRVSSCRTLNRAVKSY